MRLAITHETTFRFEKPATRAIQTLHLTPRNTESQLVHSWRIDVSSDCRLMPVEDAFGNLTHTFSIDGPIDELTIAATGEVVTEDTAGVLHSTRERLPLTVFRRDTALTPIEPVTFDFARAAEAEAGGERLSTLHALMGAIARRFTVDIDAPARLPHEVLAESTARPEDLVHLFLAAARGLDIPSRFVTGWRFDPDQPEHHGHFCWFEAWVAPALGWVAFDPIADRCPTDEWVRLAVGLDARDVEPVRGVRTHWGAETVTTRARVTAISVA